MANHITRLVLDNSDFNSEFGKSAKFVREFFKGIDDLNNGMIGLSGQQKSFLLNLGKTPTSAKNAEVAIEQLKYIMDSLSKSYNKMSDDVRKGDVGTAAAKAITDLTNRIAALKAEMATVGTTKRMYVSPSTTVSGGSGDDAASAASAVGSLSKKGAFSAILGGNLAARAVMDALRGLKNVTKEAIQTNADFEYSNATLAAVLGKTSDEIKNLTDQARRLGSTSMYSAKEISELQVVLARLGFNQTEINDSTDAIAKLALATGVDLNKAANLTGSTLRAFGYDAKEAARVASVLGVSTIKSALDMQKLAVGMSYASSVSRQAGFEIEEVVAMLGKMADNGMQATTAGVNIRNIMLDLSDKSSRLSKAIKKVTGKDHVRGFEDLISALRKMRDEGMNLDDVAATMERRVSNGFLNIVANTEGVTKLAKELKNCTGELDVMADKMENTVTGATKKLQNAWGGLMLTFSESNGTIKEFLVTMTQLVNMYAKWRMMRQGGEGAIAAYEATDYESGRSERDYKRDMRNYEQQITAATNGKEGKALEKATKEVTSNIYETITSSLEQKIAKRDELQKLFDKYEAASGVDRKITEMKGFYGEWAEQLSSATGLKNPYSKDLWYVTKGEAEFFDNKNKQGAYQTLAKLIAKWNVDIATLEREQAHFAEKAEGAGSVDMSNAKGLGLGKDETKSALSGYEERIAKAYDSYAVSLNNAAIEVENGSMTEKEYLEKKLSATQQLYRAYVMVIAEIERELEKNPALKGELTPLLDQLKPQLAGYVNEMSELSTATGLLAEDMAALRNKIAINTRIRRGLEGYAKQTGNGADYYGLNGALQDRINKGENIDWTPFENAINNDLGKKHFQIKVDVDTGSIDKIKDKIRDELSNFQTGVSAFSNIVNGFDNIKNSIDSWIETMGKGESAWDMMMSTINVGISTLQTTASIIDSILTLTELSEMASDAMTASTMRQATASGVNTIAKAAETQATKEDAKANIVDASAKAMNAHAWIPWVGVAIGVAAVATLIASLASAKNAGNFAEGGIVPGNSPTGDKLIAHVNSGEGILTAQGVRNLGSLYAGQGYRSGSIEVYGRVSGKDILLASNNYNRARGGSRGAYTQIK